MNGVNENLLFPELSAFLAELIIVEQIGGHHHLGLHVAMVARDYMLGDLVVLFVTGYPSKDCFLDNRDFILI